MPTATPFGTTAASTDVLLYTLQNARGAQATISTYGGILTSLLMPDKKGQLGNVVLGFDSLSDYTNAVYQQEMPFFGALIGRYGNRIRLGKFTLDGQAYSLPINNAPNSLHGGRHLHPCRRQRAAARLPRHHRPAHGAQPHQPQLFQPRPRPGS